MKRSPETLRDMQEIANEMACELISDIMNYYHCTFDDIDRLFRKLNYWKAINNDDAMCSLAHDYDFEDVKKQLERLGITIETFPRNGI